jgi:hypothetical protein
MLRYLKALLIFARFQAWVDDAGWGKEDAEKLANFLGSPTGYKLRVRLLNTQLQQQALAVTSTSRPEFGNGFCNGQKGLISTITALSDPLQFPDEVSDDTEPHLT